MEPGGIVRCICHTIQPNQAESGIKSPRAASCRILVSQVHDLSRVSSKIAGLAEEAAPRYLISPLFFVRRNASTALLYRTLSAPSTSFKRIVSSTGAMAFVYRPTPVSMDLTTAGTISAVPNPDQDRDNSARDTLTDARSSSRGGGNRQCSGPYRRRLSQL